MRERSAAGSGHRSLALAMVAVAVASSGAHGLGTAALTSIGTKGPKAKGCGPRALLASDQRGRPRIAQGHWLLWWPHSSSAPRKYENHR
jgi:hypothetical protein